MKLTMGAPVNEATKPLDCYFVKINVMHGDGDHYEFLTMDGFRRDVAEDIELLESLLATLTKMYEAHPNGRGGGNEYNYRHVTPDFDAWFSAEDIAAGDSYEIPRLNADEEAAQFALAKRVEAHYARTEYVNWPLDVTMGDFGSDADIVGFKVLYRDEEGERYHVDFKL